MARPNIMFVGEQDGPAEREFMRALNLAYKELPQVEAAYLARVQAYAPEPEVVLCVRTTVGEDATVIDRSLALFQGMFSIEFACDILFLDAEREAAVRRVCKPFYLRS